MSGALSGLRVVELSRGIAGPLCASLLGDMGADVIKVENPDGGEESRNANPTVGGESYYFMLANRNKRDVTLNLKDQRGRDVLMELVKRADVFVQNLRPGTAERLGAGYEALREVNRRLVYCSISGFGQDGPYRDRAAYDLILQAMSGIMSLTGPKGGNPTYVGVPIVDVLTAVFASYGTLAAVHARGRTGEGQLVDASLFDSSIAALQQLAGFYFATGQSPGPGRKEDLLVPYGVFAAKDGPFVIEANSSESWKRLCSVTGLNDFAEDPRFSSSAGRSQHREIIIEGLSKAFEKRGREEWLKLLAESGVPAGPINSMRDVFSDPHTIHRKMVTEVDHPTLGRVKLTGPPVKLSQTPTAISIPPPTLGQHTEEVLHELGYDPSQIRLLRECGVL